MGSGNVVPDNSWDKTRKVTFWTSCDAGGSLLDTDVNYPDSNVHSVERDFAQQIRDGYLPDLPDLVDVNTSIRDICSLTKDTKDINMKERIKNIKGDASEYAVKVYSGSKSGNTPKWSACGYLKFARAGVAALQETSRRG